MLNTFRAYNPAKSKSSSTACEACYSRKVKCELLEDGVGLTCKQCADHGVKCKPRVRKRKVATEYSLVDDGYGLTSPAASKRQKQYSESNASERRRSSNINSEMPGRSSQRSSTVSIPDVFVNRDAGTAISPTSVEQSEPTQDRFRNASFISRSAILGDDFQDIDHAHAENGTSEDRMLPNELQVLKLYGCFDLPDLPLRQSLVEAYIERCYTFMPVADLSILSNATQLAETSLLLLQAVILVGALMRSDVCSKSFCDRQYQRVKALIQSGYERNPLNLLAAICLVQWYAPIAPRDISTDVGRFWNTYGVGLAHQMGLQRPPEKDVLSPGLRSRIWSTMRVRDNITASAHGRPRIIQPEDCTMPTPTVHDFPDPNDIRSEIFTHYVAIAQILGDLCQSISRYGEISTEQRQNVGMRIQNFLQCLPESLRLFSMAGLAHQYNFDLAQLHVIVLVVVIILYRPRTVFQLTATNAASVTAAFLSYRICQAIELREETRFLGSPFAFHILTTAIPLLSCTKVDSLQAEANEALDAVESVLETLGNVRPAATNNLRSVRAIRKAMKSSSPSLKAAATAPTSEAQDENILRLPHSILSAYGAEALQQYGQITEILGEHCNTQADRASQFAAHTLSSLSSGRQDEANITAFASENGSQQDVQNAFTAVFEDETLSSAWMMRSWMDDFQM